MICFEEGDTELLSPMQKLIGYMKADPRLAKFDITQEKNFIHHLLMLTKRDSINLEIINDK